MRALKKAIQAALRPFDVAITRNSVLETLRRNENAAFDIELLLALPGRHAESLLRFLRRSTSQLRQDLFALSWLDFKRNGFFVEFGATNGIDLSNTYLMETDFGWTGILAEPARCWLSELKTNRKAIIDTRCVWKETGKSLTFNETSTAEFSTISDFGRNDAHRDTRKHGTAYPVSTVSLLDLLHEHRAPREIDYLSIDTEGSEFEILNSFDFAQYSFKVITCEHNFTPMRDEVFRLLSSHGYKRVLERLSKFDDWYVRMQ